MNLQKLYKDQRRRRHFLTTSRRHGQMAATNQENPQEQGRPATPLVPGRGCNNPRKAPKPSEMRNEDQESLEDAGEAGTYTQQQEAES
ncbi:hypothetical protein NDU88_005779 [Pleurodeles waltl]|uniref:Uncharacterized protein n=1 Tax=Pleurodeles waltl TaxID=8319 RepID=A0AAV7PGF2_PLEWA|nr:hypothetical protein NDU88_005779 [Pleurodeles waltl]